MKRKHWLLLLALLVIVFALSGCGVPHDGVENINAVAPDGPWQSFVVWPLAKALVWLNDSLANLGIPYNWGFAIIVFTFIIKLLTLPLTLSQLRGMQAQRELQPKVQELQKKFGNDRNRLAQEQMKLYQEAGVNPLSGCLPLVIQMPILFGLYAALVVIGPNLRNSAFFWIPDLSFPTMTKGMSWLTESFSAGQYGHLIGYLILPVLLMVSQFVMQKSMTPPSNDPQVRTTQQITLMMTFMFGFFTLTVPAGLTLYWVTSNLLQLGQQWMMMRGMLGKSAAMAAVGASSSTTTNSASTANSTSSTSSTSSKKPTSSKPSGNTKRKESRS